MKMLFFDLRDSEKVFFENNKFADFQIKFFKESLHSKTNLSDIDYRETDVICVFKNSVLTDKILEKFPNLRIVATRSSDFNHVDLRYCTEHRIAVIHVEKYGEISASEYAISLILMLLRNILPAIVDTKNKEVDYCNYEGQLFKSVKIGLIGADKVGIRVAKMAKALGMEVQICVSSSSKDLKEFNIVSMDELLQTSDLISLHTLYYDEDTHLINENAFSQMKTGVYLVNISNGKLVDMKALHENLLKGKVRGAALDIMECELSDKNSAETEVIKSLFKLKNVILTPHISCNTTETANYLLKEIFNSIRDLVKGHYVNRVC